MPWCASQPAAAGGQVRLPGRTGSPACAGHAGVPRARRSAAADRCVTTLCAARKPGGPVTVPACPPSALRSVITSPTLKGIGLNASRRRQRFVNSRVRAGFTRPPRAPERPSGCAGQPAVEETRRAVAVTEAQQQPAWLGRGGQPVEHELGVLDPVPERGTQHDVVAAGLSSGRPGRMLSGTRGS
jgi:hypothetical protein